MNLVSKSLIACGALLILAGLIWELASRYLPLGRLPGDIAIERENLRVYFPVMTSIILSLALSVGFYLFQRITRK